MTTQDEIIEQGAVVIAVQEPALAISIEITVQALGLSSIVHLATNRLGELPLSEDSTLIIDWNLVPRGAAAFFQRLRSQHWRGLAIILTEDAPAADRIAGTIDHAVVLEKPFRNVDLLARLSVAHPEIVRPQDQGGGFRAAPLS